MLIYCHLDILLCYNKRRKLKKNKYCTKQLLLIRKRFLICTLCVWNNYYFDRLDSDIDLFKKNVCIKFCLILYMMYM